MRILLVAISILFIYGCNSQTNKNNEAGQTEAISQDVLELDVMSLIDNAESYDGKEVILTGTVVHVCKHSGKRLHLMGADEKTKLRIEAGDIGQFERELEGSEIVAKGIFRRELIDEEYLAKWAGELGKEGDHKSHDEQEEEKGKIERYRGMMKESEKGYLENYWVDGISFETVEEKSI